ncbi:Ig-like domain-containing protein [Lysinibacillus sp. JNUCC-52]|uniref:Ig-like domain-containing protein n=1 Tax=Lysinibacillus sp. JNUCC-52 TaxID=2792480 RepID=UPI001936BB9A|nr:Ig domain-containing protein [Lysinibacillus sp. JNUCC-52]
MINLFKKGFIYLTLMVLALVSISVESALAAEVVDYEEGVTNLNNTPENSAVVGNSLKKPEKGWKRYDDNHEKLIYEKDKWVSYTGNSADYKKGSMGAKKKVTAKMEFWFLGSKINIITYRAPTYTQDAVVKIDGIDQGYLQSYGSTQSQTVAFKKEGLPFGIHKVEVAITSTPSNVDTFTLRLDAIDIDINGSLVDEGFVEESIILDRNTLELVEGIQDKLIATILPENASKKIVWSSSDENIATVDQNGNVTAIKEGIVKVTAKVENTNLSADCLVTVKKQGSTELESITLDKTSLELLEGSQDKLTATVLPEDAIIKNVVWSSSDESIATVDQHGNVTAISEGTAIITAKIENTDIVAICTVIVKKPNNETSSAILSITLVNGITKEYDVTNTVLNSYLNWFESAQGTSTFKFTKTISPYKKVTEYIVHDKIASFEVREY